MKKVPLIGAAALLSLVMVGLAMDHHSPATSQAESIPRGSQRAAAADKTPIRNTFQSLAAAAKSLVYFPKMEQAIAAQNPEILPEQSIFAEAEVRLTGVGPLLIGMTLEEATDALGLPLVPIGSNVSGECAYYQPDTLAQSVGLMVVDNRVIRIDVWPGSSLKTVSGAEIGIAEQDLLALYPDQIEATPNPYTQGKFLTFVPDDPEFALYRMVFETDAQGKVVQYRAGQFPAVTWPDGCV